MSVYPPPQLLLEQRVVCHVQSRLQKRKTSVQIRHFRNIHCCTRATLIATSGVIMDLINHCIAKENNTPICVCAVCSVQLGIPLDTDTAQVPNMNIESICFGFSFNVGSIMGIVLVPHELVSKPCPIVVHCLRCRKVSRNFCSANKAGNQGRGTH